MAERDFKGIWIPKEIWLDERLSALDKVILAEISSLDTDERGCYASNKHIAEFCRCSETKVSATISKLKKLGYLCIRQFDGRQRELKVNLAGNEGQHCKNCDADLQKVQSSLTENKRQPNKKCEAALQKMQESNIDINTDRKIDRDIIMPGAADADTGPKEPAIVNLMLNDKSLYRVTQSQIDHWSELYPAVDVKQELLKMQGWLESNPAKRKTKRGIERFITAWLCREQDRGRATPGYYTNPQKPTEVPETSNPFLLWLEENGDTYDNE